MANGHLLEIDRKMTELTEMRATLSDLVKACAGDDRPDCPILKDLAGLPPTGERGC
jgi:MerR family copper efflux transcriptional regulator